MAIRKQETSEVGGTGPAQRAEAWGPQIALPAGEKMIKDTEEVVRFPNYHECHFQEQVGCGRGVK